MYMVNMFNFLLLLFKEAKYRFYSFLNLRRVQCMEKISAYVTCLRWTEDSGFIECALYPTGQSIYSYIWVIFSTSTNELALNVN